MTKTHASTIVAFISGAVIWALFGDKLKKRLNESQALVEMKMEIKKEAVKISDLTRQRYNEIVDEVTGKYAKAKGLSRNELADLVSDLKVHWHKIVKAWGD